MSGTKHGSVEHYITNSGASGCRDAFAAIVNFLDSRMTRIASNAGGSGQSGTVALSLPGYTSDANHSGENAFGVWRWDQPSGRKVYVLLQWSYGSSFGSSPGDPGVSSTTYGVGIQIATRLNDTSPWAGGTSNAGADAKASPVWTPGVSTLVVYPRINGTSGTAATNKEGCVRIATCDVSPSRLHAMIDNTCLYFAVDELGDGSYNSVFFFGPYTPRPGITPSQGSNFMVCTYTAPEGSTAIGTLAGNSSVEGGVCVAAADGCRIAYLSIVGNLSTAMLQPNSFVSEYDEFDVHIRAYDTEGTSTVGYVGKVDISDLAIVVNVPSESTNKIGRAHV